IEATKKMVELGLGISFLQRSSFERELQAGLLAQVDITEGFDVHLPTTIFYRRGARLPSPPRAFLDVLHEMYRGTATRVQGARSENPARRSRNGVGTEAQAAGSPAQA
ncbi:MAG: hypothetical protein FJ315_02665, partial [SAR202 cluster bacterium]|nr:hypothetical protein [SAR202 cluster bacterium]